MERPLPGNGHGGCGRRLGETHRWKHRQGARVDLTGGHAIPLPAAPGRPHRARRPDPLPGDRAHDVLDCYRELIAHAPDELGTVVNLRYAPPLPIFPPEVHGQPVIGVVVCWSGEPARGERLLAPLRRDVQPLVDLAAPKPYLAHQATFDPTVPHGQRYYWKSEYLSKLDDEAVRVEVGQCRIHRVDGTLRRCASSRSTRAESGGAVGPEPCDGPPTCRSDGQGSRGRRRRDRTPVRSSARGSPDGRCPIRDVTPGCRSR